MEFPSKSKYLTISSSKLVLHFSIESTNPLIKIGALSKTILTSFERDVLNEGGSLGVESLEVEFGLSFSGDGNVYITKMSGSANLKIKFIAKPKKEASTSLSLSS
jgi:hypothetical protein